MRNLLIFVFWGVFCTGSWAQDPSNPYSLAEYPFIRYDVNKIDFPGDSAAFKPLTQAVDRLISKGEGKIEILQIGGSHIQADVYSNIARIRLQTFYPGLNGGRGFVFPYSVAKTNNPANLKSTATGLWTACRNVQREKTCLLGIAGISISTADSLAGLKIYTSKHYQTYDFNRVSVFYFEDSTHYQMSVADSMLVDSVRIDTAHHMATFYLNQYIDTFNLKLTKTDTCSGKFTFMGALLQTDDPGVVYHSIGINGASIPSFLRCQLFEEQLDALQPDLVVLSLGTNDGYSKKFDPEVYRANYDSLIREILSINPKVSIIITVPNDDYLYKRYPNKATALQETVIYDLAKKYGAGVWNFYQIMGGYNSSYTWYKNGLMNYDRIHFTKIGYQHKGHLFFNALLKMYDNHLEAPDSPSKSLLD